MFAASAHSDECCLEKTKVEQDLVRKHRNLSECLGRMMRFDTTHRRCAATGAKQGSQSGGFRLGGRKCPMRPLYGVVYYKLRCFGPRSLGSCPCVGAFHPFEVHVRCPDQVQSRNVQDLVRTIAQRLCRALLQGTLADSQRRTSAIPAGSRCELGECERGDARVRSACKKRYTEHLFAALV